MHDPGASARRFLLGAFDFSDAASSDYRGAVCRLAAIINLFDVPQKGTCHRLSSEVLAYSVSIMLAIDLTL